MTPEPMAPRPSLALAAPKKKEKPVLSFQREIEMIASAPMGPRRAIDYQPPASFLQNMDRPVRQPTGVLSDLWSS